MPFQSGVQPQQAPKPVEQQPAPIKKPAVQAQPAPPPVQQPASQPRQAATPMSKYDQPQQQAYSRTLQPKQPQAQPYGRQPQRQQAQQPRPQAQPQNGGYSPRQQSSMGYGYQPQPQPRQRQQQPQLPAQGSDEYNNYDPRARAEIDAQRSYQQQYGNMNGYRSTYDQPQPQYQPPNPSLDYARDTMSSLGYGRGQQYQPQGQTGHANRDMLARQQEMYSNRPMQGAYVGEGVYADGTPMPRGGGMQDSYGTADYRPNSSGGTPKMSDEEFAANQRSVRMMSPGYSYGQPSSSSYGQSLIQSNGGPAGGVYSGFDPGDPGAPLPLEQPVEGMRRIPDRGNAGGGPAWWQRMTQRGR